jgi:hypothetical protein
VNIDKIEVAAPDVNEATTQIAQKLSGRCRRGSPKQQAASSTGGGGRLYAEEPVARHGRRRAIFCTARWAASNFQLLDYAVPRRRSSRRGRGRRG